MFHLALTLSLLAVPAGSVGSIGGYPAVQVSPEDGCALARRIAESGACLHPEDCPGMRGWENLFGAPRSEPLHPTLAQAPRLELPRIRMICETATLAVAHRPE